MDPQARTIHVASRIVPKFRILNASDAIVIASGEFADIFAAKSVADEATKLKGISYIIERQDVDGSWVVASSGRLTKGS